MASFNTKLDRVYAKYLERMQTIIKDKDAASYLNAIKTSPDHELTQVSRLESKKFDIKWIDDLEKGLEAVDRITKDPKRFLKAEENIVPVELARKVSTESVIHLSSHTQFIRDIDKRGDVIPDKLLTIRQEDEFAIYENRFVRTLIDRIIIFMEKRYEYIEKFAQTRDSDVFIMKSKVNFGNALIEYDTKIKISIPSVDDGNAETNAKLLERIKYMRSKIRYYSTCEFMQILSKSKPIGTPVLRTNIIMKNPDYNRCYKLWEFIDSYDKLGFSIDVKETNAQFSDDYLSQLHQMMMISTLTINSNIKAEIDFSDDKKVRKFKVKPRIKHFLIDEFVNEMEIKKQQSQYHLAATDAMSLEQLLAIKRREKIERKKEAMRIAQERARERARLAKEKARLLRELKRQKELEKRKLQAAALKAKKEALLAKKKAEALEKKRLAEAEKRRQLLIEEENERLRLAREQVMGMALKDKPADTNAGPRYITREVYVEEEVTDEDELFNSDDYIEVDVDDLAPGEYDVVGETYVDSLNQTRLAENKTK